MRRHIRFSKSCREAGFSVIELMVVIVITTLILVVAMPPIKRHARTMSLRKGSEMIAGTLRLARQRAVATDKDVVVVFDSSNGTFLLFEDADGDGSQGSGETVAGPYDVPDKITIGDVSFSSETVTFHPRGSASQTGAVVLVNNLERLAQRVDLTAATGLVYVSDIYAYEEGTDAGYGEGGNR